MDSTETAHTDFLTPTVKAWVQTAELLGKASQLPPELKAWDAYLSHTIA
jgi:hypothetical protein